MNPGLPLAVGGPSRKINGAPLSLLVIDDTKAPSSFQMLRRLFSSSTLSNSPAGDGFGMDLPKSVIY